MATRQTDHTTANQTEERLHALWLRYRTAADRLDELELADSPDEDEIANLTAELEDASSEIDELAPDGYSEGR